MIRFLYTGLIRLHPRQFRARHGEEMLSSFDQTAREGQAAPLSLLPDAAASLLRQWAFRTDQPPAVAQTADGVPVFRTLANEAPRRAALAYGAVIALASFGLLAYSALHGAGRLPSWKLFQVVQGQVHTGASWPVLTITRSALAKPNTLFQELDSDGDGVLSPSEIDAAPSVLRQLLPAAPAAKASTPPAPAAPAPPTLSRAQQPAPDTPAARVIRIPALAGTPVRVPEGAGKLVYIDPLLAALDLNQDGFLSESELQYAPVVLSSLDKNGDGKLTLDEIQQPASK